MKTITSNCYNRRSVTPWLIANFHRPMYCVGDGECDFTNKYSTVSRLQEEAEALFLKYHVNLVLSGHVHTYQRSFPVYNNTRTADNYESPTAPVYILQGASGNREGNKGGLPDPSTLPDWAAAQHNEV